MWTPVFPVNPAVLIGPAVLLVFSFAFVGVWFFDRTMRYLLVLAAACALFVLGASMQLFRWPPGTGPNALASGTVYTASVLVLAEGLLRRTGKTAGWLFPGAAFAAIMGLTVYFLYVTPSLSARIYLQNFGYGLILLISAFRLRSLASGTATERLVFWVFLVFALHFLPRTVLTAPDGSPITASEFAYTKFWTVLHLSLAMMGTALALALLAAAVTDIVNKISMERDQDALTGVDNRRAFERKALALMAGTGGPVSAAVADIDGFKAINDRFGHAAGDKVLSEVGSLLRSSAPEGAVIGRIGGEEFAILVPDMDREAAYAFAERIRLAITSLRFRGGEEMRTVTSSFGIAERQETEALWALIERADRSLYEAKRTGRNRTVVARPVPDTPQQMAGSAT